MQAGGTGAGVPSPFSLLHVLRKVLSDKRASHSSAERGVGSLLSVDRERKVTFQRFVTRKGNGNSSERKEYERVTQRETIVNGEERGNAFS